MSARTRFAAGIVVFLVAGCWSGPMTITEYADGAETLVADMEDRFASIDAAWEAREPTLEGALRYWEERLMIRHDFLTGVRGLDPPESIADIHEAALDIFARITAADEKLAASVATYDEVTDHWQWVDTPEGMATDDILEEIFAFCRSSQDEFDATEQGEAFEDTPWVPARVVKVAFGCPPNG